VSLAGDRAAWDTTNYAALHGKDISDSTPTRHAPWPASSGQAPVSNGSKWVATDIATQAELATHTGNANAHGVMVGELLVQDGSSAPPVTLTNEAEDDWLYADV
jgi:hypothetical protein